MENKTAMMELIEVLEDFVNELDQKYDGDPWVKRGVFISINEAKDRLEKEKEQIMQSYVAGRVNGRVDSPASYYNQTYLNEQTNDK